MKTPAGKNSNLVLVRAGRNALHRSWLADTPDAQSFDLFVLAYAPTFDPGAREDCGYAEIPGPKVAGYSAFLKTCPDVIGRYERIALIDDDIQTDSRTLDSVFAIGARNDLRLWQPALTWDSYFSHAALLRQIPARPIRRVNFVEMMCPFFTRNALRQIEPLFHIGGETAIDIIWSCVLGCDGPLAVIDAAPVKHTRPVGALKQMNGFLDDSYDTAIEQLLSQYDVRFPGAMSVGPGKGRGWAGRLPPALRTLSIGPAALRAPSRRRFIYAAAALLGRQLFRNPEISGNPRAILATAAAHGSNVVSAGQRPL